MGGWNGSGPDLDTFHGMEEVRACKHGKVAGQCPGDAFDGNCPPLGRDEKPSCRPVFIPQGGWELD